MITFNEFQLHDTHSWVAAAIGAGVAIYQVIHQANVAKREQKKADAAQAAIQQEDARVRSLADEIRQNRLNAERGQTAMLSYQRRMIGENSRNIGNNAARAAGSAPGATQQALLRTGQVEQASLAGAGAQTTQQGMQLFGLQTPLIQDMADRKLALQSYPRDAATFRSAQAQQNSNNAWSSAIGSLSGIKFDGMGGGGAKSSQMPSFDYGRKMDQDIATQYQSPLPQMNIQG